MAEYEVILSNKEADSLKVQPNYVAIRKDTFADGYTNQLGEVFKCGDNTDPELVGKTVFFCSTCCGFRVRGENWQYYIIEERDIYAVVDVEL